MISETNKWDIAAAVYVYPKGQYDVTLGADTSVSSAESRLSASVSRQRPLRGSAVLGYVLGGEGRTPCNELWILRLRQWLTRVV